MVIMIVVTMDVMMVVMIDVCDGYADGKCGGHDCGYKVVVMIPVLEIYAHSAHVRRTKESWEDQKAG